MDFHKIRGLLATKARGGGLGTQPQPATATATATAAAAPPPPGPAAATADPLTILATFTVPAPISVAVRLRRVWYRSAAQIAASEGVVFVLSPKSRRFIYVPRTPRTSNRSCDAKTDTTIRPDDRSFARSYRVAAARRTAFAHARRDFVRTKVGICL